MLELHCHTTFSDGTLTPRQLVAAAAAAGVKALAITDHDTCAGWDEAIAAGAEYGVEIVPGLELSVVHGGRSLHILGFYPDRDRLAETLGERLAGRWRRAETMVAKLAELGYAIELPSLANGAAPGRPHLAAALMRAGYVQSLQEAFDRFLGEGKPAAVAYEAFSMQEGLDLLRSAGAVSSWAHPCLFRGGPTVTVLGELVAAGLDGIEVYHPSQTPTDQRRLLAHAAEYGLLVTGGSDYHGPQNQHQAGDRDQLNQFRLPLELLSAIKAAVAQTHAG